MSSIGVLRWRPLLVVATVLLSLGAAMPAASASTTTTTAPSSTSLCGVASSSEVRVVTTDTPCTVATHVGGSFEVLLRSGWRWGTPVSSSRSVIVSDVTKPSIGGASAVLTATAVGSATISVTGTIYCAKGKACPDLAMLWSLNVVVTKSAAAPLTLRLTSADSGDTYSVRPGDRVLVSLVPVAKYKWSEPTVTASRVASRISGRAGPSATGLFVAHASGRTTVVATQSPNCASHCSLKKHRFSVEVVVTKRG
jgi:hypothetical protein